MEKASIQPRWLHKDSDEDVLIRNYRPAWPLYLPATVADMAQLPYQREADGRWRLLLPSNSVDEYLANGSLAQPIARDVSWQARRAVPYQLSEELLQAPGEVPSFPGNHSSSYQLINDADHYYFYRKSHEHVPGVMLIEAQRQAVYHHLYHTTAHVRGEVTVSWNQVNANFLSHAELMYPIELVVDDLQAELSSRPRKVHYRVAFYQRGYLLGTIDTLASVIELRRFERLRNVFGFSNDRFRPLASVHHECWLLLADGSRVGTQLTSLERSHCMTPAIREDSQRVTGLGIANAEGLRFEANVRSAVVLDGQVRWYFEALSSDQETAMGKLIKRGYVAA
ncbi:AfsA-related hotdog domain-containing protein [Pseudomonas sp. NPDC089547]|uniref:AfsA-related hotdog domain-containing protein n=1 Tax=Pseudomonas sp. NPDC089547 TaxID=3390652 RepID=UPI003D02F380